MSYSCGAMLLSGKKRGDFCNKTANSYIEVHNNTIYLCTYHSNRYKKQQRLVFQIEDGMNIKIITIPFDIYFDITQTFPKRRNMDYLPTDCWKLILEILPSSSKLLCKFVCKIWSELLKNSKIENIDFGQEHMGYGCMYQNYFEELALAYGVKNINLDNIRYVDNDLGIWLINNGAKFTNKSLVNSIFSQNYKFIELLINKEIRFDSSYKIYKISKISKSIMNKDIIKLLIDNNVAKYDNNDNLVASP